MAIIQKTKSKVAAKKKASHPNDAYKNMVNPATGKKGQMGGEGTTPPFSNPSKQLRPYKKLDPATSAKNGKRMNKMKAGGSLKPVDKAAKPGLAKLPTAVRNKMGYQKNGGATKMAKSGACMSKKKK